jgi:hypothetical protein
MKPVLSKEQRRIAFLQKSGARSDTILAATTKAPDRHYSSPVSVEQAANIRSRLNAGGTVTWNALPVTKVKSKHGVLRFLVQGQWVAYKRTDSLSLS